MSHGRQLGSLRRLKRGHLWRTGLTCGALIDAGFTPEVAKGIQAQKGRGCGTCNNTGYKGRVGLYEVFELTDEVRQLILEGASSIELKQRALEDGMISLRHSGLQKVKDGQTTMEEVVRETVL